MADRLVYANFLTAEYQVLGADVAFNTAFDNSGNPGSPVVDATGLLIEDNSPSFVSIPQVIGAMYTEIQNLLSNGITFVGEFLDNDGVSNDQFYMGNSLATAGLRVTHGRFVADRLDLELLSTGNILTLDSYTVPSTQQIAFQYAPTASLMYASANGGAVVSAPSNAENFSAVLLRFMNDGFGVGTPNGWIKFFAVYDATVDLSLLPIWSVPGFIPPATTSQPFKGSYIDTIPPRKLPGKPPTP